MNVCRIFSETFKGCGNLKKVTITGEILVIGREAFRGCASLTEIIIPEQSFGPIVEDHAFADCASLKRVIFPKDTKFPENAFENSPNAENFLKFRQFAPALSNNEKNSVKDFGKSILRVFIKFLDFM